MCVDAGVCVCVCVCARARGCACVCVLVNAPGTRSATSRHAASTCCRSILLAPETSYPAPRIARAHLSPPSHLHPRHERDGGAGLPAPLPVLLWILTRSRLAAGRRLHSLWRRRSRVVLDRVDRERSFLAGCWVRVLGPLTLRLATWESVWDAVLARYSLLP